jgi:lipid-binding SYLF domain-containing protein
MVTIARRMVAILGFALFGLAGGPAEATTDSQQRLVERARLSLDAFLDDPNFRDMRVYVQNAYAVLVIPEALKGGFLIGAEYGVGVLMVRDVETGGWGRPAFYSLFNGSFGLQIGGKTSEVVLTIMNQGAVEKLMAHGVQLGADVGIAVGRLGSGVGAAVTTHFGEDVYAFSKSKGLYGGLAFEGGMVLAKHDWNEAFYGRPMTPAEIVHGQAEPQVLASGGGVIALQNSLTQF